jgi:hypothetical protein
VVGSSPSLQIPGERLEELGPWCPQVAATEAKRSATTLPSSSSSAVLGGLAVPPSGARTEARPTPVPIRNRTRRPQLLPP